MQRCQAAFQMTSRCMILLGPELAYPARIKSFGVWAGSSLDCYICPCTRPQSSLRMGSCHRTQLPLVRRIKGQCAARPWPATCWSAGASFHFLSSQHRDDAFMWKSVSLVDSVATFSPHEHALPQILVWQLSFRTSPPSSHWSAATPRCAVRSASIHPGSIIGYLQLTTANHR